MRPAIRKRLWYALGGAVILLILVLALLPQPVSADFATVERGPLRVTLDEEGETRVRERFVVSAPLAGRVKRIELEPGDAVVGGETVVAIFEASDPHLLDARSRAEGEARVRAAEAALGRARADAERARAELEFADKELTRSRRLAEQGIVSQETLESAEVERRSRAEALQAAEFQVRNARHELERARAALLVSGGAAQARPGETIAIRAPVDGVVLRRLKESEQIVPAGEPLLELADPADLEIVSDFLSTDAVKVRRGQKVLIERWGGDRALSGRVRRVEPAGFTKISALGVEEQRVNVVIDFEDPHEAWVSLGDGYRVEVLVVIWEADDVLKIPTSSLFRHEGDWAVFTVNAGKAELRRIEVGQRNGLEAEVFSGLEAGQQVVVHPSDAVTEGVRLEARAS